MKIIDLLSKIANGEEVPKKIKFDGDIYEYFEEIKYKDYRCKDEKNDMYGYLTSRIEFSGFGILNDEVEILDEPKEDKIEKLEFDFKMIDETDFVNKYPRISYMIETQKNMINKIIDKLNMEEK